MVNKVSLKKDTNDGSIPTSFSAFNLTTAPNTIPIFLSILLGGNSAAKEKILCGKSFIARLFKEVSSHVKTALDRIKEMIASFGGKANKRFPKI